MADLRTPRRIRLATRRPLVPKARVALALALTALAPAAAAAPQCGGDDPFEPNDTCSTAAAITTPFFETGLRVFRLTSEDHYALQVPPGQLLDIDLVFSHAQGDIDLFLYDAGSQSCGSPFQFLAKSDSSNDDEGITWTNVGPTPVDVIVKVLVFPGAIAPCNVYDMRVTMTTPQQPCDPAVHDDGLEDNDTCATAQPLPLGVSPGLWASRVDGDFYRRTIAAGETLDANIYFTDSIADLDLFLYRASGPCGGGFQSGELVAGFTQTDDERVVWTNSSGSPVDVVLHVDVFDDDDCSNYDLDVVLSGGSIGSNYCQGATNSTGSPGLLRGLGSTSLAADDVTLLGTNLPGNQFALFVTSRTPAFVANAGGSDGNLCIAGAIGRYNGQLAPTEPSGRISLAVDVNAIPQPTALVSAQAGETWRFQVWHRDATPGGSNFSTGLAITFEP